MKPLVATILCGLSAAVAACGFGVGPGPVDGEVSLSVTTDYGRTAVAGPTEVEMRSSDTVMRILDRTVAVETSYGGRFVDSIEGIETTTTPTSRDWFYFVDGVAADIGAAEFEPRDGDSVWWDYRDWSAAMDVGAVTGSYPAPLADASREPVELRCPARGSLCRTVANSLVEDGISVSVPPAGSDGGSRRIRVEIGPFGEIPKFDLDSEPAESGVFARFARSANGGTGLEALDQSGEVIGSFGGGTGLIAALREPGEAPVWVVTGTDHEGVERAASALDPAILEGTYAVIVLPGGEGTLPVPADPSEGGRSS